MRKNERVIILITTIIIVLIFITGAIMSSFNNKDKPKDNIIKSKDIINNDSVINSKDSIILSQKIYIKMLQQMVNDNN